jgi:hypothetical protein
LAVSTQQQEPATQRILVYGEQSPSRTQRQAFCKRLLPPVMKLAKTSG